MSNEEYWQVTVGFPAWTQGEAQYPPFGVKYLIKTPTLYEPDWEDGDERWISYGGIEGDVVTLFSRLWSDTIGRDGKPFNGEILFVERQDVVYLGEALSSEPTSESDQIDAMDTPNSRSTKDE